MSLGEMISEEATAIFPGEDAGEAPQGIPQSTDVQYVHFQQVSWLSSLDMDGPTEVMDLIEVAAFDILGVVVILDLSTCPVQAL